jgi:hypothetical protein
MVGHARLRLGARPLPRFALPVLPPTVDGQPREEVGRVRDRHIDDVPERAPADRDRAGRRLKSIKEFESSMKKLLPICKKNSTVVIWVFWYKKASKIPTDMSEDVIRNFALFNGLVDVKVCAVNEIWSGLKLVVPLAKR